MKQLMLCFLILSFSMIIFSFDHTDHPQPVGRGKMPAVTTDSRQKVHMVFGSGDSLLYSFSTDKGNSFSQPLLIEKLKGLNASATRGPQIISLKDDLSVVATTEDGKIYSWVKNANGKWQRTKMVSDMDSVALEGFVSLSGDGENAYAVWLDVRNNKRNKIYGSASVDRGKTWSKNILIYQSPDSSVCECCKPSVVMKGKQVNVMFRNWIDGNRNLYLITSTDGGKTFDDAQKLGKGNWQLKGCPMDGGGIAINNKGVVNTVWRREQNIYACLPGGEERLLGEGKSCVVESIGDKYAYAWTANKKIICVLPDGKQVNPGKGNTVQLTSVDKDHLLCTWENEGSIYTELIQH